MKQFFHGSILAAILFSSLAPAQGQVLATQRVGFGLPPGQTPAPNTPGGGVLVGNNLYTGDGAGGQVAVKRAKLICGHLGTRFPEALSRNQIVRLFDSYAGR